MERQISFWPQPQGMRTSRTRRNSCSFISSGWTEIIRSTWFVLLNQFWLSVLESFMRWSCDQPSTSRSNESKKKKNFANHFLRMFWLISFPRCRVSLVNWPSTSWMLCIGVVWCVCLGLLCFLSTCLFSPSRTVQTFKRKERPVTIFVVFPCAHHAISGRRQIVSITHESFFGKKNTVCIFLFLLHTWRSFTNRLNQHFLRLPSYDLSVDKSFRKSTS